MTSFTSGLEVEEGLKYEQSLVHLALQKEQKFENK